MERTESKSFQVHPREEQYYIDLMQHFHWNLQSSQEVKVKESHLETRSDKMYSVTNTEHYIKLVFIRPIDFANKDNIIQLENEYFGLNYPTKVGMKGSIILFFLGVFAILMASCSKSFSSSPFFYIGLLIIAGSIYWMMNISKKNKEIEGIVNTTNARKQEILSEVSTL